MLGISRLLISTEKAAIAPTAALALFALVGAGGIAFDYARLASLDTELQQSADQAALAAATQLDGGANAMARAELAARNLITNQTLFGNDGLGLATAVDSNAASTPTSPNPDQPLKFYATRDDAEEDNNGWYVSADPTANSSAKFVRVRIAARQARYALTPIVGAISSVSISAEATAGLGSAICKVPPVMMCNPAEPDTNTDISLGFDANALAGRGLRLISVGNGNTAWAPGNFGYLDTGSSTSNPNVELREALGWTSAPGDCSGIDGVRTRTGAGTPVTQALNTRFDIYEKANTGNGNAASCPTGGSCPPSVNTVKDVVMKGAPANAQACGFANNEWIEPGKPYLAPLDGSDLDLTVATNVPSSMGHPRDKCHATSINGNCSYGGGSSSKIGDGNWDRNAYFFVNYGWTSAQWKGFLATGSSPIPTTVTNPSRYQVYRWEIANRGTAVGGRTILGPRATSGSGGNTIYDYDGPVCGPKQNSTWNGVVPGGSNVDRRRISAAVLNCNASNVKGGGGTVYPVVKWVELFLTEPSLQRARTDANDVYAEIIGETTLGAGASAGQVVRRDVPYLVR